MVEQADDVGEIASSLYWPGEEKEEATGPRGGRTHRLAARPLDHHTSSFLCHGAVQSLGSHSGPWFLHQLHVNDRGIASLELL